MNVQPGIARQYFQHPSQLRGAKLDSPKGLPDHGFVYYANGYICGAFHRAPWQDAWFAHYGVKPEGWGKLTVPAREIMAQFCADHGATCLLGWTETSNRAAIAFAKRIGFRETGTVDAGRVTTTEWRPEWQ